MSIKDTIRDTIRDTIAAISTPPGRSARGIVRVSGPRTDAAIAHLLAGPRNESPLASRGIRPVLLQLPPAGATGIRDGVPLPAQLISLPAPASYTGDDTAELLLPGSPHVLERVLGVLTALPGVRHAEPGEFTKRAFLAGRISLDQAEGVAAVIAAENDTELRAARALVLGEIGQRTMAQADRLASLLALVEAGIDFTEEEDVVAIEPAPLADELARLARELRAEAAAPSRLATTDRPSAVLLGPPNAGKSTLFNALLRRTGRRRLDRSVESPDAGSTRDVLRETLLPARNADPAAPAVDLLDLPGIDRGHTPGEPVAEALRSAAVVVLCEPADAPGIDQPGVGPELADLLRSRPVVRVRTKMDRAAAPEPGVIAVCALDGRNLDALTDAIFSAVGLHTPASRPRRHLEQLALAAEELNRAIELVDVHAPHATPDDLVAAAMRSALDHLGEVTGAITPDDVLGRIFASFCIGK